MIQLGFPDHSPAKPCSQSRSCPIPTISGPTGSAGCLVPSWGTRGDVSHQRELHSPSIAAVPAEQGVKRSLQKVEIGFAVGERERHQKNPKQPKPNKTKHQTLIFQILGSSSLSGKFPESQCWSLGYLLSADFAICVELPGTSSDTSWHCFTNQTRWFPSPSRALETGQGQAWPTFWEGGLTCGQRTTAGPFCRENVQNGRAFPGSTEHGGLQESPESLGKLSATPPWPSPSSCCSHPNQPLPGGETYPAYRPGVLKAPPYSLGTDPEPQELPSSATTGQLSPRIHR